MENLLKQANEHIQDLKEQRLQEIEQNNNQENLITIEPKVMEPYQPIPGRVPRKVDIERKRIAFSSVDIKEGFEKRGIKEKLMESLKNRSLNWIQLKIFDDKEHDDYTEEEWLFKAKMSVCEKVKLKFAQKEQLQINKQKTLEISQQRNSFVLKTSSKVMDENLDQKNPILKTQQVSVSQNIIQSPIKNDQKIKRENKKMEKIIQKQQKEMIQEKYEIIKPCNECNGCLNLKIPVQAIWLRHNQFDIKSAILTDYDQKKKQWKGFWEDNFMTDTFSRLMFHFEAENPQKWMLRLQKSLELREVQNIKLKKQFLIEKMKKEDLNQMDLEQLQRICKQTLNLKKIEQMDTEDLVEGIKYDFKRTMNKIIFEKKILNIETPKEIQDIIKLTKDNFKQRKKEEIDHLINQRLGLINLKNKRDFCITKKEGQNFKYLKIQDFNEMFKEFCFSSLFIKKESILALQEIRLKCQVLRKKSFFSIKKTKNIQRLDEFKTIQESAISQMMNYLKSNWVGDLIEIIKKYFSNIGKGWFNMKETNRLTYEFGKLKRFLTVVRLIMQDTLRELLKRSLEQFVDYFKENIPYKVIIENDYKVINTFKDQTKRKAILSLDIVQVANKNEFNFLFKSDKIKSDILSLIQKVIEELKKIPDLEPKILEKLHKAKKNENFVLTPILPKEKPKTPNPKNIPKRYPDENLWLWELHDNFKQELDGPLDLLEQYRQKFSKHEILLKIKPDEIIAEFEQEKGKDMNFIKKEIQKWQKEENKLKEKIPEKIQVSCFSVNCKEAIRILLGKYQDINKKLIEMMVRRLKENSNNVQKQLQELEKNFVQDPQDIDQLTKLQTFVKEELPNILEEIKHENHQMSLIYDLLENQNFRLSKNQLAKRWELINGPKLIVELIQQKEKNWDRLSKKYEENLEKEKQDFKDSINSMKQIIGVFQSNSNITEHEQMKTNVEELKDKLKNMIKKGEKYNHYEKLFEIPEDQRTDISSILQLKKQFTPFYNFWKIINYWMVNEQKWMKNLWDQVDVISAEKFVDEELKVFNQSIKNFKRWNKDNESFQPIIDMSQVVKKQIENFKKKVPLLVGLKKEGIKQRHWEEIQKVTKIPLKITENLNFEYLVKQGLLEHSQICIQVGEKASRELNIEKNLNEMNEKWESINFLLQPFKETNSYVIINFDAIEVVLDSHLSDTQSLLVNPFRKPYKEDIENWFQNLLNISNVIEEWRRFQTQWCYLQPIFDSPDINKQLPNESALFKRVDTNWRQCIQNTKLQKNVLKICLNENYLEKFQEANQTFDQIQKELKSYLEVKRLKFGRFYFLSNDDLLSILSQTKEVEKVQDHLRKVFENISKLEFSQEKKILAMFSVEKEKVKFVKVVDPNMKQVEDWMVDVERAMMDSVRACVEKSIIDYKKIDRNDWVIKHPGQCVLNGSQVHWTQQTEEAIQEKDLLNYYEKQKQQLEKLVSINREKLSKNQFITIEALIVIDVHANDVIQKLISQNVQSVESFEWISQLRYYWVQENLQVQCLQTKFPYGYEYLGNSSRLVITPLTDKCYITLMGALKLNLGGAPAGPAGTGKTETTKDLAKALAKQCVVFNCQESMDYQFVGKFFKGLASSGAWCCFDEFNRINVEVLSVIAQQLQELFGAKSQNLKEIKFEGSKIKIKTTFSVFITMNPGYAGRTELPDNLKALFRPVAMMVPDYALIAEIKLYSFGFQKATVLSKKLVATFKLASEQLSSQNHYDYGMRAVMSVINAAGILKKKNRSDNNENQILLKALQDVNIPKFLIDDLPLFRNIIQDLFPQTKQPVNQQDQLKESILRSCEYFNLQPTQPFLQKVLQLYDTIQVRHGLMLVGPAGGGKTSTTKVLSHAISQIYFDHLKKYRSSRLQINQKIPPCEFQKINIECLNPKSVTMSQLYGEYKEMNWNEGIIELIFEKAIKNQFDKLKQKENFWILFDGPVDALWIESMNTVLDDNKKLCLSSGKVLILSPFMVMMFEVEDLSVASPATVSRCGMVYIEPESLGVDVLIQSFLKKIEKFYNAFLDVKTTNKLNQLKKSKSKKSKENINKSNCLFVELFNKYVQFLVIDLLSFVREECKEIFETCDNNLVNSFCKIFYCMIQETPRYFLDRNEEDDFFFEKKIGNLILFCSLWSIGCTGDFQSRKKLENFLIKQISENEDLEKHLQIKENFYLYRFDFSDDFFQPWMQDSQQNIQISANTKFNEISVPTVDSQRMQYLMHLLTKNQYHVLTPGKTGTGKSTNAIYLMQHKLSDDFISTSFVLSAQTNSEQILETVLNQITKRQRGVFGPSSGKKLLLFIDDLNMPKKEVYGAQPPIELLREYLDHQKWFVNELNKEYIKIEDLILLGAMGPPSGGRSKLTQRFMRHFNIFTYTELDDQVIEQIFNVILQNFLKKFSMEIKNLIKPLVKTSVFLYNKIKKELLPIPGKQHYLFSLRDLSKVFSGLCSASQQKVKTQNDLIKLWVHESSRVFHDRLINLQDREFFLQTISDFLPNLNTSKQQVFSNKRLIFSDFHNGEIEREYCEVQNLERFKYALEEIQEKYNLEASDKQKMNLVLFLDACEHISRISRILRQPQGHALLLGVGGSGKKSLTKISSFIVEAKIFSVEVGKGYTIQKWREDLNELIYSVIVENKQRCFILSDNQIINEEMLEDVNCLLNTGTLLNIKYSKDQIQKIEEVCKQDCKARNLEMNKINLFQMQVNRVKKNTHIVLSMSPLGEQFWNRLRMFPALINCCTINWFLEWPQEALRRVALGNLKEFELDFNFKQEKEKFVEFFNFAHKYVEKTSKEFCQVEKRYNYVTPTSFLDLLKTFQTILKTKSIENDQAIKRLKNGIQRLKKANSSVEILEKELKQEEPELRKTQQKVQEMNKKITNDKELAAVKKEQVEKEELIAKEQKEKAQKISEEVQKEVEQANKELAKTLEKIKLLKVGHLKEMQSFTTPPDKIKYVFIATTILVKKPSEIQINKNWTDQEVENYFWTVAKKDLLKDTNFLQKLRGIDFKGVSQQQIKKIQELVINHPKRKKTWVDSQMKASNVANYYLFLLVNSVIKFNELYEKTEPLRQKLEKVQEELAEKEKFLTEKKEELNKVKTKLDKLESQLQNKKQEMESLENKMQICTEKLQRAQSLTNLLSDENERWNKDVKILEKYSNWIEGKSMLSAAMISYAGPFSSKYRQKIEKSFLIKLKELGISLEEKTSMKSFLGEQLKILKWNLAGLPKDETSIENGIIMDNTKRWPYLIDPQKQAFTFLKRFSKSLKVKIEIIKQKNPNLMKTVENCIKLGKWLIIADCSEYLNPSLEPVLVKQIQKIAGTKNITIGEKTIQYNDGFKLFMVSNLVNPKFTPETCAKMTIINFCITPIGLVEQMLAQIVIQENQSLEQQKNQIVQKNAQDQQTLRQLEDLVLKTLSETSDESFLSNPKLIEQLADSKKTSTLIQQRVHDSKIFEKKIDNTRENYRKLAIRASLLYFTVSKLVEIDCMYEFSLEWYIELFIYGLDHSQQNKVMEKRLKNIESYFTYLLYKNVCRSLFEKHKLLYSFLLCLTIVQKEQKLISDEEMSLFLQPKMSDIKIEKNPTDYISQNEWPNIYKNLYSLQEKEDFQNLKNIFMNMSDEFKDFYLKDDLEGQLGLPKSLMDQIDQKPFNRLLLVKAFRSDKLLPEIQKFIAKTIGQKFVDIPNATLEEIYNETLDCKDSQRKKPLIILLSQGSDPKADFDKLVAKNDVMDVMSISLGQGQGANAEKMILKAIKIGTWVLLQNCHLAPSWMDSLENIINKISSQKEIHQDFRLWLTTTPTKSFPISILQNSIRITMEPPSGVKSTLMKSYNNFNAEEFDQKSNQFKKLLFGLCFFHAIVQNRKFFGPIGWNIPYQFTNEDLHVCQNQIENLLQEYSQIPYKVINFVCSEINYGGRVTDYKDLRLIKSILKIYICPEVLKDTYKFSRSGIYTSLPAKDLENYQKVIEQMPLNTQPEVFWLHSNAEITTNENNTLEFVNKLIKINSSNQSESQKNSQDELEQIVNEISNQIPQEFDQESIKKKYKTLYEESMNTVLNQEIVRYNKLLKIIRENLRNIQKANRGFSVFTPQLEKISNSLKIHKVPEDWQYPTGFLSMKPLNSWITDLNKRVTFLKNWIEKGKPDLFWFSGFFFPQAFITGTLQNYARKHNIAIDELNFKFVIKDQWTEKDVSVSPEDGVYIHGIFLEGGCWDYQESVLSDPKPKELYSSLPIIWLLPKINNGMVNKRIYNCPLYKVVSRRGTLSTTGHSTNFVMDLELPIQNNNSDQWIRKGVAAFLSLRY